ncbi:MAG TPA: penicillin-binding protein activator [Alphaproteobacteria bacterium]|nr:penicillin-binding protein activator [Alphaproteobacteria bacterium]
MFSTWCLLLFAAVLLNGCAQSNGWVQKNSWVDPSTWFSSKNGGKSGNGNVDQNTASAQTTPGFSNTKEPLAAPEAAPRSPVQVTPLSPMAMPGKAKVALLLPLKGKNAALGLAMENAAQQAVFDSANNNFELMPRDTGDGDAGAEAAARDAIASGAQLLIGPVFSANIPAVKNLAQTSGISMLTLSTDTSQAGPGVYVMGFTPAPQVERIISYASSKGLHHFGALLPANAYGTLVGKVFQDAVAKNGGVVVDLESYDPAKHDLTQHIATLAQHRDQIDALFLPEGSGELITVSVQLANAGFDNNHIRVIGTGLWDEEKLAKKSPFLLGGWYAASDPAARQNFVTAYKNAYNQDPPRLATLAYDATALAAVLAKRGMKFDSASLTNPNGFAGLDGIFRLTPDGLVQRGLAVIEVTGDGTTVMDPSPTTFAGN